MSNQFWLWSVFILKNLSTEGSFQCKLTPSCFHFALSESKLDRLKQHKKINPQLGQHLNHLSTLLRGYFGPNCSLTKHTGDSNLCQLGL